MAYALIPALLWALGSVCTARSTRLMGVGATNRRRLSLAVVVLGAWLLLGPGVPEFGAAWGWLLFSGMLGLGLGDLAMLMGYRYIGARITVLLLLCLAVPISGVSEWLWLGTKLGWREVLPTIGILIGVTLTIMPGARVPAKNRRELIIGVVFGVLAAMGQGLGTTISRVAYEAAAMDGLMISGVQAAWLRMIGGLVCTVATGWLLQAGANMSPIQLAGEAFAPEKGTTNPVAAWLWLLAATFLGPIIGLSIYQWVLITQPGALVQAVSTLTPVIVIPFAWMIDGDRPDWRGVVGGILACACAILLVLA